MPIPSPRYSELPAIWRACPCPKATRVYVAMSEGLNRRDVLGTASDKQLKPYVANPSVNVLLGVAMVCGVHPALLLFDEREAALVAQVLGPAGEGAPPP